MKYFFKIMVILLFFISCSSSKSLTNNDVTSINVAIAYGLGVTCHYNYEFISSKLNVNCEDSYDESKKCSDIYINNEEINLYLNTIEFVENIQKKEYVLYDNIDDEMLYSITYLRQNVKKNIIIRGFNRGNISILKNVDISIYELFKYLDSHECAQ